MIRNAAVIFLTTVLMAAAGALFWVIAARLHAPAVVGLAGSLISAVSTLSYLAQLGLNITLVRTLRHTDRPAADVCGAATLVFLAGLVASTAYVVVLPWASPRLHDVLAGPWRALGFVLLVGATAVNLLTDAVFLGLRRVTSNLVVNGVVMSIAKCVLPFVLVGGGAYGLLGSVGLASAAAALAAMTTIVRRLPDRASWRPSSELVGARGFAGASYLTSVLDLVPQLVLPILVVNASGAAASGVYFISFQIATLLNALVYAVGSSMYAEGSAATSVEDLHRVVRKAGLTLAGCVGLGALVLVAAAPLLLRLFGGAYAESGERTLQVLALGGLGVAFNYWSAIRLRLSRHLLVMVVSQATTTTVLLGLAGWLSSVGPTWVALGWTLGQLGGGVIGYTLSRTVAPMRVRQVDGPPTPAGRR